MTTAPRRSANRRLLAGADSFQMVSHRCRGYWLGTGRGGLREEAAGTGGQTQEVEMTFFFFVQQNPRFCPSALLPPVIMAIIKNSGKKRGVWRGSQDPGAPGEGTQGGVTG